MLTATSTLRESSRYLYFAQIPLQTKQAFELVSPNQTCAPLHLTLEAERQPATGHEDASLIL